MKLKRLFLGAVFALILMPINNTFADAQDFYFEDFTADYYLTKLEDGTSNLHVKEVLTAVFLEMNQNHGITRTIPYTNQGGANRTVANEAALNLTVLRNGKPENINKIVENDGYFTVYIGSASEYVYGEQVYTLEYDYTDVITEFDKHGMNVSGMDGVEKAFQELYWDANGTGWKQEFGKLTARLHVPEEVHENMFDRAWCYVGSYGEKGEDRCVITPTEDGYSFETEDLAAGENLTFVTEFKPDTFDVVLEKSYILIILLAGETVLVAIFLMRKYLRWRKTAKTQHDLYKNTFVAPQYQPPENNIYVADGEQVYLKKTESSYVATLLELAVSKAVTIKKIENEKKYDWAVILNVEPGELSSSQKEMMNIIAGDGGLAKGDEYPIQKHKASRYLATCAEDYRKEAIRKLERHGYLVKDENKNGSGFTVMRLVWIVLLFYFFMVGGLPFVVNNLGDLLIPSQNAIIVGGDNILLVMLIIFIVFCIVSWILKWRINRYKRYTEKGIKLVKYLEGLELYINMAEADRLKFLQSVEGADTSNAGIVKLYEKLLPWASLFGAEESWVKELEKYYEIEDVNEAVNSDVLRGMMLSEISHDISMAIVSSTNYHEPISISSSGGSGGSWSSSSSGGGGGSSSSGGGFSGGGGGGGGGGGW